ncbi:Sirohydrochlorin cobaltochelatase CbiK [hydrothermal vent metagenome]|uniref:Sirohydrochlorin cobaltochelatase CbiK n=1 Tax=hydrothermal vent metagenome TaxID=652676 RepID=A0A1W1BK69_9ZZZZ
MKRYRHYKKDKAIILACFGSVIEQEMYLNLKKEVEEKFEDVDVFLSFSSRMVLKDLHKRGMEYKNLPQVLADVDMLGYRNIIVASINLFPTDEHELLGRTVEGFKNFSYANIRATKAIINKTKETSLLLKNINDSISKKNWANLFVIHGVPILDLAGLSSVSYTDKFLKAISKKNYTCSLEGAFPYYAMKESLIEQMKADGVTQVQVVPMLLVSGNHYFKDMIEISDELGEHFESRIVPSITNSKRFNLIELEDIRSIIFQNIKEEITKLG